MSKSEHLEVGKTCMFQNGDQGSSSEMLEQRILDSLTFSTFFPVS